MAPLDRSLGPRSRRIFTEVSTFLTDAAAVVTPLQGALRDLIASASTGESRRRLRIPGLHATLNSRLRRGLETESVPASLYHLPGPDGLRRALAAARAAGATTATITRCNALIDAYEEFLRRENLTLDGLQAMLSGFLPEGQEDVIQRNAQSVFTAMRNISGSSAEGMVYTAILWPASNEVDFHEAMLRGYLGWERLRADAWPFVSGYSIATPHNLEYPAETLDGQPVQNGSQDTLLREFCSGSVPEFRCESQTGAAVAYVHGPEIGVRSSCDVVFGERIANAIARRSTPECPWVHRMFNTAVRLPLRRLTIDVLMHDEVWPGLQPVAECYRLVPDGRVNAKNLERRGFDRVPLGAGVVPLRRGLGNVETSVMGRYRALLESVFGRLRLPMSEFRGYRLEAHYPLYGCQYSLRFDLRQAPAADESPFSA